MKLLEPLLLALLAAFGNALFAASQKKIAGLDNTLTSVVLAAWCAPLMVMAVVPLFGPPHYGQLVREHGLWVLPETFAVLRPYP